MQKKGRKKRSRSSASKIVEYNGYTFNGGDNIERVNASSLDAEEFFKRFVVPRKPCIITGVKMLSDEWTHNPLEKMKSLVGDSVIEAEIPPFGSGKKVELTLSHFVDKIKQELLYMTTQRDQVERVSEPLRRLVPDVLPLHVPFGGNLTLANLNMWCGKSEHGSKTPLHVDFHDNFYWLLRGTKQFFLFSPADAPRLHTRGEIVKVYPNGLVNFKGCETNADGSTPYAVAEKKLAQANDCGDEDAVEEALQEMLEAEEGGGKYDNVAMDGDPSHFCTITAEEAATQCQAVKLELHSGEMLYLPCGFFHQVHSSSHGNDDYHMAINWWYHPPDTNAYDRPYSTICWYEQKVNLSPE